MKPDNQWFIFIPEEQNFFSNFETYENFAKTLSDLACVMRVLFHLVSDKVTSGRDQV